MPKGQFLTRLRSEFYPERNEWMLLDELIYQRPCGEYIIGPKEFYTDLASTKNLPFFPRDDVYNQAAAIHDLLYTGRLVSKWLSDKILVEALISIPEVPRWKIPIMYAAVVSPFGVSAWNRNSTNKIRHTRRLARLPEGDGRDVLWKDNVFRFC